MNKKEVQQKILLPRVSFSQLSIRPLLGFKLVLLDLTESKYEQYRSFFYIPSPHMKVIKSIRRVRWETLGTLQHRWNRSGGHIIFPFWMIKKSLRIPGDDLTRPFPFNLEQRVSKFFAMLESGVFPRGLCGQPRFDCLRMDREGLSFHLVPISGLPEPPFDSPSSWRVKNSGKVVQIRRNAESISYWKNQKMFFWKISILASKIVLPSMIIFLEPVTIPFTLI